MLLNQPLTLTQILLPLAFTGPTHAKHIHFLVGTYEGARYRASLCVHLYSTATCFLQFNEML